MRGAPPQTVGVTPPASLLQFEKPLALNGAPDANPAEGKGEASKRASDGVSEILDAMLPARTFQSKENGGEYMQYVSKAPVNRLDVITLQEQLDQRLMQRQARDSGICPVREDLYSQTFDEAIRQVTLTLPERGLLLLRVRDELRMTIDAYKTLYDSSITFGVRKQLQAEQGMTGMDDTISGLQGEVSALKNQILELTNKAELMEKRNNEMKEIQEKKREGRDRLSQVPGSEPRQILKEYFIKII